MTRINRGRWGYVSNIDVGTTIRGVLLDLFLSKGKVWLPVEEGEFEGRDITNFGVRSNFAIQPLGKNYNVSFEIGKVASEFKEFTGNWRISVSISASTVPRFYVPVPGIIKTTGQIRGEIFIDNNGNGFRDLNEPGVPQVLMFLEDEDALSDGDGKFEFTPVETGEYPFSMDVATLPGYLGLVKEVPGSISVRRGAVIFLQIPVVSVGSIDGNVFRDVNTNDRFDADERGMAALIRIIVQNDKGREWEAFTNSDGYYVVTDLLPGIYTVVIDSRWLPKRTLPTTVERSVMLTSRVPHQTINLAVVKEKLKIKKTFVAPKRKKE